jgi:hypothetical protein
MVDPSAGRYLNLMGWIKILMRHVDEERKEGEFLLNFRRLQPCYFIVLVNTQEELLLFNTQLIVMNKFAMNS